MRVLVVEDDERMSDLLRRALGREGYAVDQAASGVQALGLARENEYDVLILDVMIPAPDGFAVLGSLRAEGIGVPVIMLTALDEVEDRVAGLDWGADDYLTKPFELAELLARVRALTRREPAVRAPVLRGGGLALDPARHTVDRAGRPITLSATEFALLQELLRHTGEVLTRAHLREHVWDAAAERNSNVVDVYIGYLREKIDRPFGTDSIETVRGVGYRLHADPPGDR